MADINLIPQEQRKTASPLRGVTVGLVATLVIVAAVFGCFFVYGAYLIATKQRIDQEKIQLNQQKEAYSNVAKESAVLQRQLTDLPILLEKHLYWSELLWKLEERTLKNVALTTFKASVPGTVTMEAVAPNYGEVGKQVVSYMSDPFFVGYTLGQAGLEASPDGNTQVSFSLTLHLADRALFKTDAEVAADLGRTPELPIITPALTPTPSPASEE